MHFLLYVCVPTDEAKTSLQARRYAIRYLNEEHFVHSGRFCGMCDYFSVGGRYECDDPGVWRGPLRTA